MAKENLRPAIIKYGLTKMVKMSIDQLEEILCDTQCEFMDHGKSKNIANSVSPIYRSDDVYFSSEYNIKSSVGDRVSVFWSNDV